MAHIIEATAFCPGEPCPACGPGHCTPSCPERAWRYPDSEDQYPSPADRSRSRAHGGDAPGVDSADPLRGTGVKHPRPWRVAPWHGEVLIDRNGNQVGRLASAELAQIVVACVNAQPEGSAVMLDPKCSTCGAPVPPYVVPPLEVPPMIYADVLGDGALRRAADALPPPPLPHLADALGQTKERQ